MEQKLTEFRTRRMAEKAAKKADFMAPSSKTEVGHYTTVYSPDKNELLTKGPIQSEDVLTNKTTSAKDSIQVVDSSEWLLESAVGRWLGLRKLAFTNLTVLKFLLWLVLLGLFAELDFGFPFFLISLFYWLYEGLRSPSARKPGELSAYSVFNPDCQPLLGTLTTEQLEGEMGYMLLAR